MTVRGTRSRAATLTLGVLAAGAGMPMSEAAADVSFGATSCSAYDDPWADPPSNCVSLGNNYTHTFEFVSVRSDLMASFRAVLYEHFDQQTDLQVWEKSPADVVIQDNNYGYNGAQGWVNCDPSDFEVQRGGSGTTRWCFNQDLRVNLTYQYDIDTIAERQSVACHEFAHTVGMRHNSWESNTCIADFDNNLNRLNGDEVARINSVYLPY